MPDRGEASHLPGEVAHRTMIWTVSHFVMSHESSWPIIENAVAGGDRARRDFTKRYLPVIRAYLGARWRGGALSHEIDDAVQDVFVECFRDAGALQSMKLKREDGQDFRGFLLGVVRNVARRVEARHNARRELQMPSSVHLSQIAGDEASLSHVFDQAWAQNIMRQAAQRQAAQAESRGPTAQQRVEILRLRFHEGLAIREIAKLWDVPPARLHHEYAKAREDFRTALREIVGEDHPGSMAGLDEECERLLDFLD